MLPSTHILDHVRVDQRPTRWRTVESLEPPCTAAARRETGGDVHFRRRVIRRRAIIITIATAAAAAFEVHVLRRMTDTRVL